MIHIYTPL